MMGIQLEKVAVVARLAEEVFTIVAAIVKMVDLAGLEWNGLLHDEKDKTSRVSETREV